MTHYRVELRQMFSVSCDGGPEEARRIMERNIGRYAEIVGVRKGGGQEWRVVPDKRLTAEVVGEVEAWDDKAAREGLHVLYAGPVIIEGVRHRVENQFVACDASLNRRAWNITAEESVCRICYPLQEGQLELFEAQA